MFKQISTKDKCPDDFFIVANVYSASKGTDKITSKIICQYKNIGRSVLQTRKNKKVKLYPKIELEPHEYIKNGMPNTKLRDIVYVSAAQGAGKTTYVKNYTEDFHKVFPKKPIVLLSRIEDDEAFRDMINKNIIIPMDINDQDIVDNPIQAKEEMPNTLVIFDDYLSFDKEIEKSLKLTLKDIMLNGRDQANYGLDIYCVITSHQIMDYQKTRDILNESSTIVLFPKAGQVYHITRCLKLYCGMTKKQINDMFELDTRWIAVHKRFPQYLVYEGGVIGF